jgi:hypothetical protein
MLSKRDDRKLRWSKKSLRLWLGQIPQSGLSHQSLTIIAVVWIKELLRWKKKKKAWMKKSSLWKNNAVRCPLTVKEAIVINWKMKNLQLRNSYCIWLETKWMTQVRQAVAGTLPSIPAEFGKNMRLLNDKSYQTQNRFVME